MPLVDQSTDEAKQTQSSARCACTSCHNSCFTSTLLSEMMTATTPFQSSTVNACSQRATKRVNAHQRHTRSVQSSSCAEVGFFSSSICIVHGLQPKLIVLSRCCSILSAIRIATRRNSTCHQIEAYLVQLRHAVHRFSVPNDNHRAP